MNSRISRQPIWTRILAQSGPSHPVTMCVEWTGSKTKAGYPVISWNAEPWYVHRLVWTLTHGAQIASGIHVCHRCDNPACINPDHLFLGTDADNHRDKQVKGRAAMKMTEEQVRAILIDGRPYAAIAKEFGCDRTLVGLIKARKVWDHVHVDQPIPRRPTGVSVTKIPDEAVPLIFADPRPQTVIAAEYGVSQTIISDIKRGKRRAHLTSAGGT